jgi:hypothetical protein
MSQTGGRSVARQWQASRKRWRLVNAGEGDLMELAAVIVGGRIRGNGGGGERLFARNFFSAPVFN